MSCLPFLLLLQQKHVKMEGGMDGWCGSHTVESVCIFLDVLLNFELQITHATASGTPGQLTVKWRLPSSRCIFLARLFRTAWYIYPDEGGSRGREGTCFSYTRENNREGDNEPGPPVKVISKWGNPR